MYLGGGGEGVGGVGVRCAENVGGGVCTFLLVKIEKIWV